MSLQVAFERFLRYRRPFIVLFHAILVFAALFLAFLLRFMFVVSDYHWSLFWSTVPLLLLLKMAVFAGFRLFEGMWRSSGLQDLAHVARTTTIGSLAFGVVALFLSGFTFPRSVLLLDWVLSVALVSAGRLAVRALHERGAGSRREPIKAIVVGADETAKALLRSTQSAPVSDYEILGLLDDDPRKHHTLVQGVRVLGPPEHLPLLCAASGVEQIVVAIPWAKAEERRRITELCRQSNVPVKWVPSLTEVFHYTVKRASDFVGAGLIILLTLPAWPFIALAVALDSRGPVFYKSPRMGKDERPFFLYKFRTMTVDAATTGPGITKKGDPRITRVGRFLRTWKLDELPQFINVIKGDMSLVGPRPEDPRYLPFYTVEQRRILYVRPGLVSPAVAVFRHEEEVLAEMADPETGYVTRVLPEKLQLDLKYIDTRSLLHDVYVMMKSTASIFARSGAGIRLHQELVRKTVIVLDEDGDQISIATSHPPVATSHAPVDTITNSHPPVDKVGARREPDLVTGKLRSNRSFE